MPEGVSQTASPDLDCRGTPLGAGEGGDGDGDAVTDSVGRRFTKQSGDV